MQPNMTIAPTSSTQAEAARHIQARDAKLALEFHIDPEEVPKCPAFFYRTVLSPRQVEIVELDATALAEAIKSKTYTSVEVTEAYLLSAAAAHAGTNCLAWFDADLARERAKWLDEQLEASGPVGPLHGVPMSVKGELLLRHSG